VKVVQGHHATFLKSVYGGGGPAGKSEDVAAPEDEPVLAGY